jgi:hypothetical protein
VVGQKPADHLSLLFGSSHQNPDLLSLGLTIMSTVSNEISLFVKQLLKNNARGSATLTELETLVISTVMKKVTYRQASIQYQYTESSFQNAASHLFKELSLALGTKISRQNFAEVLEQRLLAEEVHSASVFDRLQASLWIRAEKAKLVSISYNANNLIDITNYLVQYSPQFAVTYCLDVSSKSSLLELLWCLCNSLQLPLPMQKNDRPALLKSIGLALKQHRTLLVLRFDQVLADTNHTIEGDYAEILVALGLLDNSSCLLTLDNNPMTNEAEIGRSLNHQLRLAVDLWAGKQKSLAPRLISIENDLQSVCDILKTYLR